MTTNVIVSDAVGTSVLGSSGPATSGIRAARKSVSGVDDPERDGRAVGDRHLRVARRPVHDVGRAGVDRDHDDAGRGHEDQQVQHHQRRQRDALVDVERGGREEQEHERQQLGHLVADVGDDLLVDAAADLDGVHERAEVVVGEDHPAGLLRDLAAAAHRDADVGLLERRGVVDGVAGHRHDQPLLLHQPGEAELVLRRDPAEDVQLGEPARRPPRPTSPAARCR